MAPRAPKSNPKQPAPEPAPEPAEVSLDARFEALLEQVQQLAQSARAIHAGLKSLQRDAGRKAKKAAGKPALRAAAQRRAPSGFALPSELSPQLRAFLKVDDKKLARVEVTRLINAYVKERGLQNPADKRQILPDAALSAILAPSDSTLTYFNLQSRIKHHFLPAK